MLNTGVANGSLEQETDRLFREAGFPILSEDRKHEVRIENKLFSRVTRLRPQNMPYFVADGTLDVAICGFDGVVESEAAVTVVTRLEYGRSPESNGYGDVVLVGPEGSRVDKLEDIEKDAVVFTEYPNLTRRVFKDKPIRMVFSYGSTEAFASKSYGVCFRDSGRSIRENQLKVIATLLKSYTVLIANIASWNGSNGPEKKAAIDSLRHQLLSVLDARPHVFLAMNVAADKKDAVLGVLPSLKNPTVAPLADGYFWLSAVVYKPSVIDLIPKLLSAGAEDLIEMPISRLIRNW